MLLNHLRIKVACKVAKSFLTLFLVILVKVEVQESNLYQMNQKKVYFLTCFVQNTQNPNVRGNRALNDRANHYGPPCKLILYSFSLNTTFSPFDWSLMYFSMIHNSYSLVKCENPEIQTLQRLQYAFT